MNIVEPIILRLNKGEEIVSSILNFCEKENIPSAWIWGIGSCTLISLAYYNVETKKYSDKKLDGVFEIVNLIGNIGKVDNKIIAHMHISLSDEEMNTKSGHLVKATVAATCEVLIKPLKFPIIRSYNPEIGLNLIK